MLELRIFPQVRVVEYCKHVSPTINVPPKYLVAYAYKILERASCIKKISEEVTHLTRINTIKKAVQPSKEENSCFHSHDVWVQ